MRIKTIQIHNQYCLQRITTITFRFYVVSRRCEIEDWSTSFDHRGWSDCTSTSPYMKGLYRVNTNLFDWDGIYYLEAVNCCADFENVKSECVLTDWSSSFNR